MTAAIYFAIADVTFVLLVDALFLALPVVFPGGTISESIRRLAEYKPITWRLGYICLAVFLYWHFFIISA